MKNLLVGVCVAILTMFVPARASATPVYVTGGQTNWTDVNKVSVNGAPDSFLCWAATASDMLAWAGWQGWNSNTSSLISTAPDIYAQFLAAWGNAEGAMVYGYDWWFTNDVTSAFNPAEALPQPSKDFYPTVPLGFVPGTVTNFTQSGFLDMFDALNGYITNDRGVIASVEVPQGPGLVGPYSHALAIWGWDPVADLIYLTDPDDGITGLRTYSFTKGANGEMTILNYSNLYTAPTDVSITELTRLNRNDQGLLPNEGVNGSEVPEPASLTLLGLGLAYGSIRRRRR